MCSPSSASSRTIVSTECKILQWVRLLWMWVAHVVTSCAMEQLAVLEDSVLAHSVTQSLPDALKSIVQTLSSLEMKCVSMVVALAPLDAHL